LIEGTDLKMAILPESCAAKRETVSRYADDHKQSTLQYALKKPLLYGLVIKNEVKNTVKFVWISVHEQIQDAVMTNLQFKFKTL